jgi:hypothetical protein
MIERSDRCGAHQTFRGGICVCDEGYRLNGTGCTPVSEPARDAGVAQDAQPQGTTGQKAPCSTSEDCAGYDASYCLRLYGVCLVPNCTPDSCDDGWSCLDISVIETGAPPVCIDNEDLP